MVATVSALSSAAQAASYYEADDYYAEGGMAPSEWFGEAAEKLGLSGEVDRQRFGELLEGRVSGKQIGTVREGKVEHRPGWDITFSAPKSVSIMAEIAGDRRLIKAHGKAVKTALAHVEKHMAATRVRQGGVVDREATGNLAIATFRHATSRSQDPQLHTHGVILNATQDKDGNWRSLEPRAFYQLQKEIGAIYRQELAHGVAALGYRIEAGKDALFEIADVPEKAIEMLSQRTAAIDARLAERGTTREEASAAEKQIAALDTREAKTHADHSTLRADWRATADASGFDKAVRDKLIAEARERVKSSEATTSPELLARKAVAWAAAKLSEREAVFSASTLAREAGDFAFGKVGHDAISVAIAEAGERGDLVPRTFLDRRGAEFAGFTTPQAIETERTMLRLAEAWRGMAPSLSSPVAAARTIERAARQSARFGYAWTDDQKRATTDLLTSRDRITAVQGYAGTAKTTTVLATYAREAKKHKLELTALAPTASAATVLGDALSLRGDTVARHLLAPERKGAGKDAVWIVDEASMLSASDMAKLMTRADKAGARLVLVGDVKQLGSVGAGAAFAQLQQAGMATSKLAEVVRQTNTGTREAVMASIEGHAGKALAALESGGGKVIEAASTEERLGIMAEQYLALSPEERARTLMIEPSRAGRDRLTDLIREKLTQRLELSPEAVRFDALQAKGFTRAEAREAASYDAGDVVRFTRNYSAKGARRGESFTIASVDAERGRVALEGRDGRGIDWRPRQWGAGKAEVFERKSMELRTGDQFQFTRNDREAGRVNGLGGTVTGINPEQNQATLKLANGREQKLDLSDPRDTHLRHAYVQTAHAAQGQTTSRVLIHADSRSTNLVDQKMLYVALSRAKTQAVIVTDHKAKLIRAIYERAGEKQMAMAPSTPDASKSKAMGAGLG